MNDIFIIVILVISILYYYKYRLKKIEHFKGNVKEKCIKDTYNKLSNGEKTLFSNEMIDTAFDLNKHFLKGKRPYHWKV